MAWYERFMTQQEAALPRTPGQIERLRAGLDIAEQARANPKVLRAAGQRVTRQSADKMRIVAGTRQPWQTLAWGYRDMIGELRGALKFRANAISKVAFFIAEVPEDSEDDPIPVALRNDRDTDGQLTEKAERVTLAPDLCTAAEQELKRLPLDDGAGFTGIWSENFDVAGECWLHGYIDAVTQQEMWEIRSVDDVDVQGSTLTLKDELGQPRRVDLPDETTDYEGTEEMYRLWCPHPRRPHLADSTLNALMDTLEDITLTGREIRAVARSRISANGILLVPSGMSELKNVRADDENAEDNQGSFMVNLQAAMLAPISNEGDPGGVVPLVLTGSRDDIEAFRFLRVEREDSPTLLVKLEKALGRMGNSLDIPPEIITGMAGVNHWTAWQIDAATFRHHLEPGIRMMVDALTGAFLRTALVAQGFPSEEVARIRVWYSAGQITENPSRRQDAIDARKENAISDGAFREALGFGDADAPTAEEQLLMIAGKAGMDQSTAAAVLAWALKQQDAASDMPVLPAQVVPAQIGPARPQETPQAEPDPTGTGGTGAPDTAPSGVTAAARARSRAAEGGELKATAASLAAKPSDAHMCKYCDKPAVKSIMHAEGKAFVPVCEDHEAKAVAAIGGKAEVDQVVTITAAGPRESRYQLDTATGRRLMDLDRALRDQLLLAADAVLARALERAGSRMRAKATKDPALTASLRQYDIMEWPSRVGREQALALGADARFLLNAAWDSFRETFERRTDTTIDEIVTTVAERLLKLAGKEKLDAVRRMKADMSARVQGAWSRLVARLEEFAEKIMFDKASGDEIVDARGEQPELVVPPYLVRNALAEIGGLAETSGGLAEDGRLATEEAITALSTGTTVSRELAQAGVLDLGYTWVYGVTEQRARFDPHYRLEGERFTNWHDQKLKPPPGYEWVGQPDGYMRPGDHRGCLCDAVIGYALPAYADQVRDSLAVPSGVTQDILNLAAEDDQAGRIGTTAQAVRDQHAEVQALQTRFMKGA